MVDCFCGFLLVVVDVEIGGFDVECDVLLEIVVVILSMDSEGYLYLQLVVFVYVEFFLGVNFDLCVLEIIGIDLDNLLCGVLSEWMVLDYVFNEVCLVMCYYYCQCVVLVGYNVVFDLGFFNVVVCCIGYKCNLFYFFSCFDIVMLSGLVYGQIVLSKVVLVVGGYFDLCEVYLVIYDVECIVELFCGIVNCWCWLEIFECEYIGLGVL